MALPPDVAQWLLEQQGAAGGSPATSQPVAPASDPMAEIRAAMAADKEAQGRANIQAGLMHGADVFAGLPTKGRTAPVIDDNMKAFLLAHQLQGQADEQAWRRGADERTADRFSREQALRDDLSTKRMHAEQEFKAGQTEKEAAARAAEAEKNRVAALERTRISSNASGGGPGGSDILLSPEALDQAAEQYARTGVLPNVGMGKAGGVIKQRIANRAAELHPDSDLAGNKAGYHADSASLGKLQQMADNIEAFEKTGKKNIENMLSLSKTIPNLGSPALNRPLRALAAMGGNTSLSAFEAARQTAAVEAAKILGGALGPLSDSSRHEAERMMDPNATPEQLQAAASTLITDFGNRKAANAAQLAEIRGRTGAKAPAAVDADSPPEPGAIRTKSGKWAKKNAQGAWEYL